MKKYPLIFLPNKQKCDIDFNFRKTKANTEGITERFFWSKLIEIQDNFKLFTNIQVGMYFPDFLIETQYGNLVDVEIDEMYNMKTGIPTHYISNDGYHFDSTRNNFFISNGICVLRFTENQIVNSTSGCIKIILGLIEIMDANEDIPIDNLIKIVPNEEPWNEEHARASAKNLERQKLLIEKGLLNRLIAISQGIDLPKRST